MKKVFIIGFCAFLRGRAAAAKAANRLAKKYVNVQQKPML
jgi:hypothetical protein